MTWPPYGLVTAPLEGAGGAGAIGGVMAAICGAAAFVLGLVVAFVIGIVCGVIASLAARDLTNWLRTAAETGQDADIKIKVGINSGLRVSFYNAPPDSC